MTRARLARSFSLVLASSVGSTSLAGCGGATTSSETTPVSVIGEAEEAREPMSPLQALNRRAREGARTETLFGVRVEDPFFALENDTPLTREWIVWQSARTRAALEGWTRPAMSERLEAALRIGVISGAATYGPNVFFSKRDGDREQPALYVRPLAARQDRPAEERILIDPLTLGAGERAALDWYFPSPNGRYVAFGLSTNGDERSTLRVIDVETGRLLDDAIEHCKWADVAWLHSEDGFYYRRYPRAGEPDFDASQPDSYHARLFFHRLGTDPATDVLVYSPSDPTFFPGASVSDDDRYLVINLSRGWTQSDVFLLDRGARPTSRVVAPDETHALVPVRVGQDALYDARVHRGQLYLLTNEGAPRYRIQRAELARLVPALASGNVPADLWTDLVPESEATLEAFAILGDRIALHEIVDVRSRVRLVRMDGRAIGEVALPARGEVSSFHGDPGTGNLVVGFSSFVTPPTLLTLPRRASALETVTQVSCPVDLSQYDVSTARVASRDGTEVPVTWVHRRGHVPDGTTPVLLYAYGGFNISLMPGFARHPLYWLERGGVYAVANLRGGGEFGEAWHRAGNLGNKEHVFEDMEAVIRWLSSSGLSSPSRIAITGGSNGGLLMGAMITRAPETFRAAATYVGLYDMVRYHHFPPAEIWATEYGTADDEAQFRYLHAYSPYHRVRDGQPMPAVLVETADHDTRVYWGHSTKFAARLQEATGSPDPEVWFYREEQVGHGAGTPVSALVARYVRMYAFVEHALGMIE
ncbi:MAG: prolyl oligopeptidase family serine peptidase [Sandaracinaceae bacterium]